MIAAMKQEQQDTNRVMTMKVIDIMVSPACHGPGI